MISSRKMHSSNMKYCKTMVKLSVLKESIRKGGREVLEVKFRLSGKSLKSISIIVCITAALKGLDQYEGLIVLGAGHGKGYNVI